VTGCMMPSEEMIAGADTWVTLKDGISINYTYSATVNDISACGIKRRGCMDSNKLNYDPAATVSEPCYDTIRACLNIEAANYNCLVRQDDPCPTLTAGTVHDQSVCKYKGELPEGQPAAPTPPAPLGPAGQTGVVTQAVSFKLSSTLTVSELLAEMSSMGPSIVQGLKDSLGANFNQKQQDSVEIWLNQILPKPACRTGAFKCANDDCSAVTVTPTCPTGQCTCPNTGRRLQLGRRLQSDYETEVETTVSYENAAEAAAASSSLDAVLGDTSSATNTFLSTAPGVSSSITAVSQTETTETVTYVDASDDANDAAIIGGAVAGGVVGILLIGGGAYYYMQMKKKGAYAKTVVPA